MSDATTKLRRAAVARAVEGAGKASKERRRAAFESAGGDGAAGPAAARLVAKVAEAAWTISDEDVAAAKAEALSEDEIFELVVCAAYGQATRQLEAGLAALAEAEAAPAVGRDAQMEPEGGS